MVASSQQPALWAEHLKLIVPSQDGKPETTHDGPLRECGPLLADALRRSPAQQRRSVVLLTEASKVGAFVVLLRKQQQQLLIGSISEHQWLVPALDVIVGSPEQVLEYQDRGWMFSSNCLKALLVDLSITTSNEDDMLSKAFNFASTYIGFEAYKSFQDYQFKPKHWFSPPNMVPPSPAILNIISGSPETWDDTAYIMDLRLFAWGSRRIAVQNWCDIPVLLPGIIRGSLSRTWKPLVVAPREKLDQMIRLLHTCADQLGFFHLRVGKGRGSHVRVECPEELIPPTCLERLVIIDADKLLDSPFAWKINRLVRRCLSCPIGVQFSSRTPVVEELLSAHSFLLVQEPRVTMKRLCEFVSLVGHEDEKLDRVCSIWKQLERSGCRISIFCNSAPTVVWLAGEMRSRGFSAWSFSSEDGEDVDPQMYKNRSSVLVTNVYRRTWCEVINFDLPDSIEEYVERVGTDRSTSEKAKMVINIFTPAEQRKFAEILPRMVELPKDCSRVHQRLGVYFEAARYK